MFITKRHVDGQEEQITNTSNINGQLSKRLMLDQLKEKLTRFDLNEDQLEILNELSDLFAEQIELFDEVVLGMINQTKEMVIGRFKLTFNSQKLVTINRVTLMAEIFNQFLNEINIWLTEIYPVGSVVEIKPAVINGDETLPFSERLCVIMGQRVAFEDGTFVDYIAYPWPDGVGLEIDPIYLCNSFINQLVFEGYKTEDWDDFF
ncbi:DUF4176 domain-containing protein [Limosilactobacillus equigenerosi]|uniref:DUF4176 domain-containing protein n=1 Tax=Limosilactobacillus equigenerosi TaxID=417373 RepID=UPI0006D24193|nr:DUF4176 domain-containing protein [Limosilactobacillus equigenerosi]